VQHQGVQYDTGTMFRGPGYAISTRRTALDMSVVRRELAIIRDDLHANAVRIGGSECGTDDAFPASKLSILTLGVMTKLPLADVADAFASVTAEALNLPEGDVPAPQGERLVAIINDWLATRNWRLANVRDPQTFAWPGSWIALAADERSPKGWRPVLMFGDPSGVLHDPLGSGQELQIVYGLLLAPLDRRRLPTNISTGDRAEAQVGHVVALMTVPRAAGDAVKRQTVTARPGGTDGDRYQDQTGTFSTSPRRVGQDITFIEAEALADLRARGVTLAPEQARRNVVTNGIDLDALIGKRFPNQQTHRAGP
jgi:hypothetical protein